MSSFFLVSMPRKNGLGNGLGPAVEWRAVATIGRIRERRRNGKPKWFLDFSPFLKGRERRLTSDRGYGFESLQHAEAILAQIRGLHARMPLSEAVGQYRQANARPNLVSEKVAQWIKHVGTCGDYQPATIVRYRGYTDGHFAWWKDRSVYDVQYHTLDEWITWLRERGQSAKSIKNILAAFRTFYTWLRRGREQDFPRLEFPRVKTRSRRKRSVMDLQERAAAIAALPAADRGIFLALKMGIRPGEARALRIEDYDFAAGVASIREALKSQGSRAVRGETKTGEVGDYPVSTELREWISEHIPEARRFQPRTPRARASNGRQGEARFESAQARETAGFQTRKNGRGGGIRTHDPAASDPMTSAG
jgi:integrase